MTLSIGALFGRVKEVVKAVPSIVNSVAEDVLWFGGAAFVSIGIGLIYMPASFIFFGAALMLPIARKVTRWL